MRLKCRSARIIGFTPAGVSRWLIGLSGKLTEDNKNQMIEVTVG